MARNSSKAIFYVLASGVSLLAQFCRNVLKIRLVSGAVISPTASAPQGKAALQGFAWPLAGTYASLGNLTSVYVEWTLQEKRDKKWFDVEKRRFGHAFLLCDQKGLALVELSEKTEVELEPIYFQLNEVRAARAAEAKLAFGGKLSLVKAQRIREIHVAVGSPVYALGEFHTSPGHSAHGKLVLSKSLLEFRARAGESLRSPGRYARWLDGNGDGIVCEKEAKAGFVGLAEKTEYRTEGSAALAPSLPEWAAERAPENLCHGSIRGATAQKLYVSDCHQTHLILKLRRWNTARLFGGLFLIGAGVYWLIVDMFGGNIDPTKWFLR